MTPSELEALTEIITTGIITAGICFFWYLIYLSNKDNEE